MINQRSLFKKAGDTLWLHCEGRTYSVSLKSEAITGGRSSGVKNINNGLLVSPMPGKIHKIPVKVNETVKAGTTVCIIEAMKMEYALKAPFDGIVKKILKKEGDRVNLDEDIVLIAKE